MKVDKNLLQLMNEMDGQLSVLPYGNELMKLFRDAYKEKINHTAASLSILNALFGEYGLVVLIPDNAGLKNYFNRFWKKN
jgi:hypothetical protein